MGNSRSSATNGPGGPRGGPAAIGLLPLLLLLSAACAGSLPTLAGCQSTALSLDDPNAINATFDPEFLGVDVYEAQVEVQLLGVEDSSEPSPTTRAVGRWDFGADGNLFLSAWEFHSDFTLTLGLRRFAGATKGRRTLSLEIINSRGTFLARGEFFLL